MERASSAKRRAEPTVMPDGGKRVDDDVESVSTASDLSPSEWSVVLGESRSGQPIALGEEAIPLRPLDDPATFPADHEQPFQYLPLRRLAAFFSRPSVRGVAILAGSVLGRMSTLARSRTHVHPPEPLRNLLDAVRSGLKAAAGGPPHRHRPRA